MVMVWFGLSFIVKLPLPVALDMFISIISYSIFENLSLIQSVTPFLGDPHSYEYKQNKDAIGDVAAKEEAVDMIRLSDAMAEMPTEVAAIAEINSSKTSSSGKIENTVET